MPALADLTAVMDGWFPPETAENWDAVGLTCGDPQWRVDRVLLAVDCVPEVVDQAVADGAQLLITHHPLLLTGVHGVPTTDPKGALVHRMIRAGLAHLVAHTNADVALGGVSDALAARLGLNEVRPLDPLPATAVDHLAVFVPDEHVSAVSEAMFAAGASTIGDYDRVSFAIDGRGTFRPLAGASPHTGTVGEDAAVAEVRLSTMLPRARRAAVLQAMRAAHPYEEVAFELTEQPPLPSDSGTGRIGRLAEPTTLAEFTKAVARALPTTAAGVRAAGDPERRIEHVAVCGGSGASYRALAERAGADVYVTADLKHHQVSEAVAERPGQPMALVDTAHWASEAPWLELLHTRLTAQFGAELTVSVSRLVTDPWTLHAH